MIHNLLFVISLISIVNVGDHNVPLSLFHIYQSAESTNIDVTFDTEDLLYVLDISLDQLSTQALEEYLRSSTEWKFDDCESKIEVLAITVKDDHTFIEGTFEKNIRKIQTLKIHNQCLDVVLNHSNIIQLDLQGKNSDFRMHKKRQQIVIEF